MKRREFLTRGGALAASTSAPSIVATAITGPAAAQDGRAAETVHARGRTFSAPYNGEYLNQVAFPIGGMGAGMFCVEGNGALSKFSFRHRPDLERERRVFAAIALKGHPTLARVLEGPVPKWKLRPRFGGQPKNSCWGLPRFTSATFEARFPFATISLKDEKIPIEVELTAWSPFSPGDADSASLPVASLGYRFVNRGQAEVAAVFSFNAENFMTVSPDPLDQKRSPPRLDRIRSTSGGFVLCQPGSEGRPWDEGYCAAWVEESGAIVDHAWFSGDSFDQLRMVWSNIASASCLAHPPQPKRASPGASIFVPFRLSPAESKSITLHLVWYVPRSSLFEPSFAFDWQKQKAISVPNSANGGYQPWYAGRFAGIEEVKSYWQGHCQPLRKATELFSRTFYRSTLPAEVLEAVAANLTILKSPTVLRQLDGRLWGWEGSDEDAGDCYGSSNHVWNYAQALAHLFPDLERGLRETELGPNLGHDGFQAIRAALPIRSIGDSREDGWGFPAAADGQLGGVIKVYREWRISGDAEWLRRWWPRVRLSLDYCIRTWDPEYRGWIEEPHINTFDRTLWGPDSMCTSLYVGALKAGTLMGQALGESIEDYTDLLLKAIDRTERLLFNGEYFIQKIQSKSLRAAFPQSGDPATAAAMRVYPEMMRLARQEGPPYQYGSGCLSAGVLGAWLCWVCGIGDILDKGKVESHLMAVAHHNMKDSLADYADAGRPEAVSYASGDDGGLLLCSWPNGGRPSLPMLFADEVWTGVEYQVASHLIAIGHLEPGLEIVRACRRRYDGRVRNPFDEVEAGHWYARAMSSYALLQAFSGARFDAVDKILYLKPSIRGDFVSFLSTATGYGTVGVRNGKPFIEVVSGEIPYSRIEYTAA